MFATLKSYTSVNRDLQDRSGRGHFYSISKLAQTQPLPQKADTGL